MLTMPKLVFLMTVPGRLTAGILDLNAILLAKSNIIMYYYRTNQTQSSAPCVDRDAITSSLEIKKMINSRIVTDIHS